MVSKSRRIGIFIIDALALDLNQAGFRKTFEVAEFLPIAVRLEGELMVYTGLSPSFDEVKAGAEIPVYEFSVDDNGVANLKKAE